MKSALKEISKTEKGFDTLLVDADGHMYPIKILLDGKLWMTTNLNSVLPNSYCYENLDSNCKQYGRLYTWESADRGCKLLGKGWRLPTGAEGKQLTGLYGRGNADSSATRKEAFKTLMDGGNSGFNAVLGGNRDPNSHFARGDAHGFYWTTTEGPNNTMGYFNFAKGSQALYMQTDGEKVRAFSVRCVKSTESSK